MKANPAVTVGEKPAGFILKSGNRYTYVRTVDATDLEGNRGITVSGSDVAGNTFTTSFENGVVIDKTAPTVSIVPQITGDTTPDMVGSAADVTGVTSVTVTINGDPCDVIVSGGTWRATALQPLAPGVYEIVATAVDGAGNVGTDTSSGELTVDLTAPIATIEPQVSRYRNPVLRGTAIPSSGAITGVIVSINGNDYAATVVGTQWSAPVTELLPDGEYDISVRVTDSLGRIGVIGSIDALQIDATAPSATITLEGGNPTSANLVVFRVAFSESMKRALRVTDISLAPGSLPGSVFVSADGSDWLVTMIMTSEEANGQVAISIDSISLTDPAGNPCPPTTSPAYTIFNWQGLTVEPQDTLTYTGGVVQFEVGGIFGGITPTFHWRWSDGVKSLHDGPDTAVWVLENVSPANNGEYWCEIGFDGEMNESAHATLTVADHLVVTKAPEDAEGHKGQSLSFRVDTVGGYAPLHYEWHKNGDPIPGSPDGPEYAIASLEEADAGWYSVEITDSLNDAVETVPARLTVLEGLPISLEGYSLLLLLVLVSALRLLKGACQRSKSRE